MHNQAGQVLLLIILLFLSLGVFRSMVSRAREAYRGRDRAGSPRPAGNGPFPRLRLPGSGILEHRRQVALEKLRHRHALIRDEARHRIGLARDYARHQLRLNERQAEWDRTQPEADVKAPPRQPPPGGETGPPLWRRQAPPSQPGTVPGSVVADDGPPRPQQAPPPQQPGGKPMSVEQVVDGTSGIHARAQAGNIRTKQWAVRACAEVFTRLSAMMLMLSRALADRRYGPEITEPLAQAGMYAQAAAMACGESDTQITTLANMTLGDLADSPRQAPDREELSETGAH